MIEENENFPPAENEGDRLEAIREMVAQRTPGSSTAPGLFRMVVFLLGIYDRQKRQWEQAVKREGQWIDDLATMKRQCAYFQAELVKEQNRV